MSFIIVLALYLLPAFFAYGRKHHNADAIAATNILLGWTLIGWIVAFIWSLTATKGGAQ